MNKCRIIAQMPEMSAFFDYHKKAKIFPHKIPQKLKYAPCLNEMRLNYI